jgi:hypothetical protein
VTGPARLSSESDHEAQLLQSGVGVETRCDWDGSLGEGVERRVLCSRFLHGGGCHRFGALAEEPHQSFDVLCSRSQKELLLHKLQSAQAQTAQSDLILHFREQGFNLLPLPLCLGELWRVDQLPRTLPGWFILVDDQAPEGRTGTLGSERARATLFACPDVAESAVPMNAPSIIQPLAGGTEIAVVFWAGK